MKQYKAPDFEVALFEVEDVITLSPSIIVDPSDPNPGDDWY